MDILLERAAHISPDVSGIQKSIALAYATMNQWDDAGNMALNIGRPSIRNDLLIHLSNEVLKSDALNPARLSINWLNVVSDPVERYDALFELSSKEITLRDPIAYTQLITLLTERPQLQKTVIERAVRNNPNLASLEPLDLTKAVTDREQELVRQAFEEGRLAGQRDKQ